MRYQKPFNISNFLRLVEELLSKKTPYIKQEITAKYHK